METNGYRLLLPEGTLDYFNISDVKESRGQRKNLKDSLIKHKF